ncbi:unnamed protein product, partial [Ilex paraguariensis]
MDGRGGVSEADTSKAGIYIMAVAADMGVEAGEGAGTKVVEARVAAGVSVMGHKDLTGAGAADAGVLWLALVSEGAESVGTGKGAEARR